MSNVTTQNRFSTIKRKVASFALALSVCLTAQQATAQQCLTGSLNITTGYDPTTGLILSYGLQDPKWTVTSLTPDCQALAPAFPPYQAYAVAPDPSWASSPSSDWISFLPSATYPTTWSGTYSMTLSRYFTTCLNDKFRFDFPQLTWDQDIDIRVDGVSQYYNGYLSQFGSFTSTSFILTLPAGPHTIAVVVNNLAITMQGNGHGLNFAGTITSMLGLNSIIREDINCPNRCIYTKTLGVSNNEASIGRNMLLQNSPNPFVSSTSIEYNIDKMQQSAAIVVTDMLGRQVGDYPITAIGKGKLTMGNEKYAPGNYIYSLIVDGVKVDSKRMSVIK